MGENSKIKGIKTSKLFYPVIAILGLFQIIIIVCSVFINISSSRVSDETKKQKNVNSNITQILASSSKLSDTAINFLHSPLIPTGPSSYILNSGPLGAYYDEISDTSLKPEALYENIKGYSISDTVSKIVFDAINEYSLLIEYQSHSFYLLDYALSKEDNLNLTLLKNVIKMLPSYTLTEEELAYTKEEAIANANAILFTLEYSNNKGNISSNVNKALNEYSSDTEKIIAENTKILEMLRFVLWISIMIVMSTMVFFFVVLLKNVIFPIVKFSKKINNNQKLDITSNVLETNVLATAYNELLDRHNEFEKELRIVAERDSLTGLPNRYSYNEFLKKPIENEEKICVFLFDINDLKYINDNYGHYNGDELIKEASKCITECFEDEHNCYRIGGDEFVAIVKDIEEAEIDNYLERFKENQLKYNLSIAVGYSYSSNVKETGYEKIVIEADKMMYENKKIMKNS